jgi:trehalose 6-phosphate synthase
MANEREMHKIIVSALGDLRFVVVSNREPYIHSYNNKGKIHCIQPASGVVSALDPLLQATCGTWIAHGSGSADYDVAGGTGIVPVPPAEPRYLLRRIRLTPQQVHGYYDGFSNQALWPLCHMAHTAPKFDRGDWQAYRDVNALFANQVQRCVGDARAFVFIQDYHLALLPQLVRRSCPNAVIAHFWHIPWPGAEKLNICPWKEELVDGLLGSDLLGFHLPQHCENFIAAAAALFPHLRATPGKLQHGSRSTAVRPFPIGVDSEGLHSLAASEQVEEKILQFKADLRLPRWVGVGVDRLDHIKGIPERIQAIARFLELYPEFRHKFSFIQVAVPSRIELETYQELGKKVGSMVDEVNRRFGANGWKPIVLIDRSLNAADLAALYRLADFCLVTSLHDGMNLVAKEFVASRCDEDGVLLLSRFAGAAGGLDEALLINPYDIEETAKLIERAIFMTRAEAQRRMRRMRSELQQNDIFQWMFDIVMGALESGRPSRQPEEALLPI